MIQYCNASCVDLTLNLSLSNIMIVLMAVFVVSGVWMLVVGIVRWKHKDEDAEEALIMGAIRIAIGLPVLCFILWLEAIGFP